MYNAMNITTLYVSQEFGDDKNMGLYSHPNDSCTGPVKTIEKALTLVSELRGFGFLQPITIRIMDDFYLVEKPIEINETMSSITIEPFSKTTLSGGVKIEEFDDDILNGVPCKSCSVEKFEKFTDFYVGGKRARLPHYPKNGKLTTETVEDDEWRGHRYTSKWFVPHKEDFENIKNFKNVENCIISFNHFWVDEHTPIESIDEENQRVYMKYLPRFSVANDCKDAQMNYIVENVYEMFGEKNEWYYDEECKKIYYIPEDDDFSFGYIPITDKIFIIQGKAGETANNITIRNFDIAYTKGDFRSVLGIENCPHPNKMDGYASGVQSVSDGYASIEYEYAYGCILENCTMRCMGVHGVKIGNGCHGIKIYRNEILHSGAGGVVVGGGDAQSEMVEHTYGNHIKNNRILYCGRRYFSGCGILSMHSYDNIFAHNEIGDTYYTAISCGWVWGYADSVSKNNLIEKNDIHDIGQGVLSDMGGIYLLGKQPGTIVRGNVIHDVKSNTYGGWGLYADEGTSQVVFENNICYNIGSTGMQQHYGAMNVFRNNIFCFIGKEAAYASRPEMHLGVIFERNIFVTKSRAAFKVGYTQEHNGCTHQIFSSCNLIFDMDNEEAKAICVGKERIPLTLREMKEKLGNENGSIAGDPKFVDAKNYNFSLQKDSPAYLIGFEDIDTSDVGPLK